MAETAAVPMSPDVLGSADDPSPTEGAAPASVEAAGSPAVPSDPSDPADAALPADPASTAAAEVTPGGYGSVTGGDDRDLAMSAGRAADERLSGWPGPGEAPVGPPAPVPPGRGGDQRIPRPHGVRLGVPPPWAHLPPDARHPTVDDVRRALAAQGPPRRSARELGGVTTRPAAVLAPLYDGPDGATVVLTRRTWTLRSHQGEISFPGGRSEPGETPAEAARREAWEEVALDPDSVDVIGELDHLGTVTSGSFIVPLVGALPGRPDTVASPAEVDAILHVPFAELLDPAIYREERWPFPDGTDRRIYFFELVGDTLWGATAAMLRQLLGMVTGTLGRGDLGHP